MIYARVAKYGVFTATAAELNAGIAFLMRNRQEAFQNLHVAFGRCYDGANILNSVLGARVYVYDEGQSPTGEDGVLSGVFDQDRAGKPPTFAMQCDQQLYIEYPGFLNVVTEFFKPPFFGLTGNATIEFTVNSY